MEEYPILSVTIFFIWNEVAVLVKVSSNLGFGFGIGPKPKQRFLSYTIYANVTKGVRTYMYFVNDTHNIFMRLIANYL